MAPNVEFAPMNTPLHRRLQTLAALWMVCTAMFGELLCIYLYFYILTSSQFYWLGIIYTIWLAVDRDTADNGGRLSKWTRNPIFWNHLKNYFPCTLIKTADFDPSKNYLMCIFPHGLLSTGAYVSFCSEATGWSKLFPGITVHLVTLSGHFIVPFFRDWILSIGMLSSSKQSIENTLGSRKKGEAMVLIVGGAAEALYCRPGQYKVILKKRKGFIKLALKNGTPLVPVYSFGETNLYSQVENPPGSWLRSFQEKCKQITGLAPAIPLGRGLFQYTFGVLPQRRPVYTVVGAPMEVPRNPDPSPEDIDKTHAVFTEELVKLFNEHKKHYLKDYETAELEIE